MNTILNVDNVWPERVPGHGNTYVAQGQLERVGGRLLQGQHLRAMVVLSDDKAIEIIDWMLENTGHTYPYTLPSNRHIVGLQLTREPIRV